ncbi:MAG: hypothetical protein JST04_17765 [Bdellovibrionales bacterium]|nr:hypothetical protein [Bdellovibrionales bacterium]
MPLFLLALLLAVGAADAFAAPKCGGPDMKKVIWTRTIREKTVPAGVEIFDRVWLKNPTATPFVTYVPEKGAAERTGYRALLPDAPTTKDELPGMKLVNGERYEYHYPENPVYDEAGHASRGGWVRQDYPAGLVEPELPKLPPNIVDRIFDGKTKTLAITAKIPYYFGKKRGVLEMEYRFKRNPSFGQIDPACASPTPSPSAP